MAHDSQLVQACMQGDSSAFEILVRKYQSLICGITFSGTNNIDHSEELAQETFLKAWKNLASLKDVDRFRPWLCTIARNLVRNYHRQNKRGTPSTLNPNACLSDNDPSELASTQDDIKLLERALQAVPPEYREPLVLFYRCEQSIQQVSQNLDLKEATVRTRLHRGRQMLKEQTAALVEQTLARTNPKDTFTKAVMAGIGTGLAAGTMAVLGTASAAASLVQTSTAGSSLIATITGFMTTLTGKIALTAATLTLAVGLVVHSQNNIPQTQPTDLIPEVASAPTSVNGINEPQDVSRLSPTQGMDATSPTERNPIATIPPTTQDNQKQTPRSTRHPDWPLLNEPLRYCSMEIPQQNIGNWIHLPRRIRKEDPTSITIDNGLDQMKINKMDRSVQHSESPYLHDKRAIASEDLIQYLFLFGRSNDPSIDPNCFEDENLSVEQIAQEDNGALLIFKITTPQLEGYVKTLVDAVTRLPEKMEVHYNDPNSSTQTISVQEILFDFSIIPEYMFQMNAPNGYTVLPRKQPPCFRGEVIDELGNQVAGAEVFAYYFPLYDKEYLTSKTDEKGHFEIPIPSSPGGGSVHLPVCFWATIPHEPDYMAWTVLHTNHDYNFEDMNDLISGYGGDIIQSENKWGTMTSTRNGISREIQVLNTYQHKPVISNISLVMQQAGIIAGHVTNEQGDPIDKATLTTTFSIVDPNENSVSLESWSKHWNPKGVTNESGYYEINQLPALWKGCEYTLDISAVGYVAERKQFKIDEPLKYHEFNISMKPQQVTIRGVLKDNLGVPLAGRSISLSVPNMRVNDCHTQTDTNGVFVLEGCPDVPGLELISHLSTGFPYNFHELTKKELLAYKYYPDVTQSINYQAGQREYVVELTAIRPEMKVKVLVTDTFGQALPNFKVCLDGTLAPNQFGAGNSATRFWGAGKLKGRTNEEGEILFDNIPDITEMKIIIDPQKDIEWETSWLMGKEREQERKYLDTFDKQYTNLYQPQTLPIELIEGQTEYTIHIVVLPQGSTAGQPPQRIGRRLPSEDYNEIH